MNNTDNLTTLELACEDAQDQLQLHRATMVSISEGPFCLPVCSPDAILNVLDSVRSGERSEMAEVACRLTRIR